MTVVELSAKLKAFDVKAEAIGVISNHKTEYLDRNKDQMRHGEKPSGALIGKYAGGPGSHYSKIKAQMNPLPGAGNVDLEYTKQFKAGMFFELRNDDIEISSRDSKASKLESKYADGSPFYGLNTENQDTFNNAVFLPDFLKAIEQKTGLRAD